MFGLFSVGFLVFAAKALKIKILAGSATDPEKQEAEERPAIVLAMSPKSDKQGKLIFTFIGEMLISYILKDLFQVTLHSHLHPSHLLTIKDEVVQGCKARKVISEVYTSFVLQCTVSGR